MLSLIDRIEHVAESNRRTITFVSGDEYETLTWGELHADARAVAAGLQARGVGPGDHVALLGPTLYIGKPSYKAHGPEPIKLQAHGDPSAPISFRNIWVRPLPDKPQVHVP